MALAAVLLVRPAISIAGVYDRIGDPWGQIGITAGAYVIWIATVLVRRDPNPIRTLVLAGVTYGAIVSIVSRIALLVGDGPDTWRGYLVGPLAVIGTNALFGAAVGALAAGLQKLRR